MLKCFQLLIAAIISVSLVSAQKINAYKPDFSSPPGYKGYKLKWNDEFNNDEKPDSSYWRYENGFVRNKELQWYQERNAYCKKGSLIIEGKREKIRNNNYTIGSSDWKLNRESADYTSASINTKGLFEWQFGRLEVRARIDTTKGAWPAIWTLGVNGTWPANGEVDVMEFYRIKDVPTILVNVAWGTSQQYVAKWNTQTTSLANFTSKDAKWCDKFHTWKMDWNKDSINLYLDGELINKTSLNETINADSTNPFLQPHYLLLNLAIGENGGDPSHSRFPIKFEVDYVRVYEKEEE